MALMDSPSTPLGLSVANHATGQAVVYIGQSATLDVQLVNATGTDLAVRADAGATLTVYFPDFYSTDNVVAMAPDLGKLPGWTAAPNREQAAWVLTYTGQPVTWSAGGMLRFAFAKAASSTTRPVTNQSIQVNPSGIAGLPPQVQAALTLIAQPQPGHLPLAQALRFSLENQGVVYVSSADDPLANQLTLTISNIGDGPLWSDPTTPRPATPAPKIVASFLTGGGRGALAPADKQDGTIGSAWNIRASVTDSSGGEWGATNPAVPSTDATPSWTLSPSSTNRPVLGGGTQRSVGVTFSNIVSFLLPGRTQMVLHCSGFTKDKLTQYDEAVFFLDVIKQFPPPTRGLISFYGPEPLQEVDHPNQPVSVPLRWTMTNVASVALISSEPGTAALRKSYASPPPALAYDSTEIKLPGVTRTTTLMLTLQAFDGASRYLNSLQFAAQIQANMFIDPRDGIAYPVVKIGRQFWMAANLAYLTDNGSWPSPGNAATYGRFYTADAAALSDPESGWRLPSVSDWQALCTAAGGDAAAYAALIAGGRSKFEAQLGGFRANDGNVIEFDQGGFYWTATPGQQGTRHVAQLSSNSRSVSLDFGLPAGSAASVRYVRDA